MKVQILRIATARMKINQIPFFLIITSSFSVMTHNSSVVF